MAQDIATTDGRPSMAYFGEMPWYGLGTKLERTGHAVFPSTWITFTKQ